VKDSDGDIPDDKDDAQPAGILYQRLSDKDGDGIADKNDKCPMLPSR
jgi:hypothetical protein